ncbi:MAG: Polyprenyl synthetase [Pseudonocardiales bacterium]|nr:Polyprenyl synthetase [Jatrophihabitantaceae bacterium]MCW2603598.1 Polyprenyl synthetase [Pseudonocardiales bacterium]
MVLTGRLEDALHRILDPRLASLELMGADLAPIANATRAFVLNGGKRLRPQFAYWGWRSVVAHGAPGEDAMLELAASLELVHACALVHDDLMDGSDSRRGAPSVHVRFETDHRVSNWPGDARGYGAASAILVGDLLLSWADAAFAAGVARLDPAPGAAAQAVVDLMHQELMAGQFLDVMEQARGGFSPDAAARVIEFKTSKYTVERPLQIGAAAAGGDPEHLAALSAYALPLGQAFQLRDDVLGVFGDPAVTGKPAGDDLREGKRTLLVALAMERATTEQRAVLTAGIGRADLDESDMATVRDAITATGALDAVEEAIAKQLQTALDALDASGSMLRDDAADALALLARASVIRSA